MSHFKVHIKRGLHNDLTPIHYAITNDNIELLKILIEDLKTPKTQRCPFPTVAMTTQSTGRLEKKFKFYPYFEISFLERIFILLVFELLK
jgi:hypothetical protein